MRPIPGTERFFWVGEGVPTETASVPVGASYYNQTGGGSYRFTQAGWVALPDSLTDITVAVAAADITDSTAAGQAMLTAATATAQKVLLSIPKIYRGLLTQVTSGAPSVTVLENTLSAAVVWTRDSTGHYVGTLTGAFTASKTFVLIGATTDAYFSAYRGDANTIIVVTVNVSDVAADSLLLATPIEVLVYP